MGKMCVRGWHQCQGIDARAGAWAFLPLPDSPPSLPDFRSRTADSPGPLARRGPASASCRLGFASAPRASAERETELPISDENSRVSARGSPQPGDLPPDLLLGEPQ